MKSKVICFVIFAFLVIGTTKGIYCCTVGAVSGSKTADGRPIIWKTRDSGDDQQTIKFIDNSGNSNYSYVGVFPSASTTPRMGVNEQGFAIVNNDSGNLLPPDPDSMYVCNASFQKEALETCASVDDFVLKVVNWTPPVNCYIAANYAVLDKYGDVKMVELGNDAWKIIQVTNPFEVPDGWVVRSGTSSIGIDPDTLETNYSRYVRCNDILTELYSTDNISYRTITQDLIRDFCDFEGNEISLPYPNRSRDDRPYGYINTYDSICRRSTISAACIHGVLNGEDPLLTTMWAIPGYPAACMAMPFWPVGATPALVSSTGPNTIPNQAEGFRDILFDYNLHSHYIDTYKLENPAGNCLLSEQIFPAEILTFDPTDAWMASWRTSGVDVTDMLNLEQGRAQYTYDTLAGVTIDTDMVADFEADDTFVESTQTVQFTDKTIHNPYNDYWIWQFGDDPYSPNTVHNPTHVFTQGGVYTVTLTAKDSTNTYSDTKIKSDYITSSTGSLTWTGASSTDWHDTANWNHGYLPTNIIDVCIPSGLSNYPTISSSFAYCKDMEIQSGASVQIAGETLTVFATMSITGTLEMTDSNSELNIQENIEWNSGSSANIAEDAEINIYGNWEFRDGANVQLENGVVNFIGGSEKNILSEESNCHFNDVIINKTATYVDVSGFSNDVLNINGNLTIYPNTEFKNETDEQIRLKGNLTSNGSLEFIDNTFILDGMNQTIDCNSGDYFDNLTIHSTGYSSLSDNMIINGNLLIESSELRLNNNTIEIKGNWDNRVGADGFIEGSGKVIFNGTADQTCSNECFNTLELDKATGNFIIPETITISCAGYSWKDGNITLTGGTFTVDDIINESINGEFILNGGEVNFHQDTSSSIYMDADITITTGTFNIYGGNENVDTYWAYSKDASITMSGGIIDVKNTGIKISNFNSYTLTENITGGTIRSAGNFLVERDDFIPENETIELYSDNDASISLAAGSCINTLRINKSSSKLSGKNSTTKTRSCSVNAANDFSVNDDLIIDNGTLNLNGHTISCNQDVSINDGGILYVNDNAVLKVGKAGINRGITVNNGGTLQVIGSKNNEAKITNNEDLSKYILNIESGGTISSEYGNFSHMNSDGVNIKPGAIIDTDHSFNNCSIFNGSWDGTLLTINNEQTITINSVSFYSSCESYNVAKTTNSGTITFEDATGDFVGEAYENDPHGLINWSFEPAAPQNLSLTPGLEQISLSWNQNTETDFHKYTIYRDTSSPATTLIDSVLGASNTTYTDNDVSCGLAYYYRLKAVDNNGNESTYSAEESATPNTCTSENVIFVSTSGSDVTGSGTIGSPFATIQHGIDIASESDTVIAKPGTYFENISYNGKNIVVGSYYILTSDTSYISQTIIDGGASKDDQSCVYFTQGEGATAQLIGLTIQNGKGGKSGTSYPYTYWGGGITISNYNSVEPTISYCIIQNNTSEYHGGGITCEGGLIPHIDNCIITDNSSTFGGGGIYASDTSPVISYSLIKNNTSSGGAALNNSFVATLNNCTVINNTGTGYGASGISTGGYFSNTYLTNCIVWYNTPTQIDDIDNCYRKHTNIQNATPGPIGNISAEPLFVDYENNDFHLTANSPCVEAGYASTPVPENGGWYADIGAYEFTGTQITKNVSETGEILFGGQVRTKIDVTTLGSLSEIDITVHPAETHSGAANSVSRWHEITPTGSGSTFDLTLSYLDSELNGNVEENLNLWRWTGSEWNGPIEPTERDTSANWINVTGQTAFSDWIISDQEPGVTLPVVLTSFTAEYTAGYDKDFVSIGWSTASESDLIGFNIYRNTEDVFSQAEKITNEPILATNTTQHHEYFFYDEKLLETVLDPGYTFWYWLEIIEFDGTSSIHNESVALVIPEDNDPNLPPELPIVYGLYQNVPNPFNPKENQTKICFNLPQSAQVTVGIYNLKGQLVKKLYNGFAVFNRTSNPKVMIWDGKDEAGISQRSGIYLYRMSVNGKTEETKKMILLR